ncbi:hypothetical protein [Thalassotalea ganghwensis]
MSLNNRLALCVLSVVLLMPSMLHAATASSWLTVLLYDYLDESALSTVKPSYTRNEWDVYSLDLSVNQEQQTVLTWQTQENVDRYLVRYRIANGQWQTQWVDDNVFILPDDVIGEIEFSVASCNSNNECASYSNELTTTINNTDKSLPVYFYVPKVISSAQSFSVLWSEVPNATGYQLEQLNVGDGNVYQPIYNGAGDQFDGNLEYRSPALPDGQYCYRLQVIFAQETTGYTTPVCTTVGERQLDTPEPLTVTEQSAGRYRVSWQDVAHATAYILERETRVVVEPSGSVKSTAPLSSKFSDSAQASKIQTNESSETTNTEIKWLPVVSGNINSSEHVHTIDTFDQNGVQRYRLKACNEQGQCGQATSVEYNVPVANIVDGIPTNVITNLAGTNNVKLDWQTVPGANYYVVTMQRKGSTWSRSFTGLNEPTLTWPIYQAGEYTFNVSACISTGFCGQLSTIAEFTYVKDAVAGKTPQFDNVDCLREELGNALSLCQAPPNGKVIFSWKAPQTEGVAEYEVMGELKNVIAKRVFTADSDGYYHLERDALTEGREYCYVVRAWYQDGSVGDFTNAKCIVIGELAFPKPNNLQLVQLSAQEFEVRWDAVAGATRYLLEFQTSKSDWQAVHYSSANKKRQRYSAFHQTAFNLLGHMGYRVSACNDENICGNYARVYNGSISQSAFLSQPAAEHTMPACMYVPPQVNANQAIQVSWCMPEHESVQGFELQGELKNIIVVDSVANFAVDKQGLLTITRPILPQGREYCYNVRTVFINGARSAYHNKQCVVVGEVVFPATTEFTHRRVTGVVNRVDLLWSPITGAHHYLLEQQTELGIWQPLNCAIDSTTDNGNIYQRCQVDVKASDIFTGTDKASYRVSACNASNVCGNYQREYVPYIEPISIKTELLSKPILH